MSEIGALTIDMQANYAKLMSNLEKATQAVTTSAARMQKQADNISRAFKGINGAVAGVQATIAGFAAAATIAAITGLVKAYADAEKQLVNMNSALATTGRYTTEISKALVDNAQALQNSTMFEGDAIVGATGKLANFARQLNSDELQQGQRAIVGLAHVLEIDLNKAALMVGKTVAGQTNALARYGIQIDMNKNQHEKLAAVIGKTNSMFDQAVAASDTVEGRAIQLNNAWGDLTETMGGVVATGVDATGSMVSLRDVVQTLDKGIQDNKQTWATWIRVISNIISSTSKLVGGLILFLGTAVDIVGVSITVTANLVLKGINRIVREGVNAINNLNKMKDSLNLPGLPKTKGVAVAPQIPLGGLENFNKNLAGTVMAAGAASGNMFKSAFKDIGNIFSPVVFKDAVVKNSTPGLEELATQAKKKGKKAGQNLTESIAKVVDGFAERFLKPLEKQFDNFAENMKRGLSYDADMLISEANYNLRVQEEQLGRLDAAWASYSDMVRIGNEAVFDFIDAQEKMDLLVASGDRTRAQADTALKQYADSLNGVKDKSQEWASAMGQSMSEFGDRFFDTFITGLKTGEFQFAQFALSIIEDLSKLIFKMMITIPIAEALQNALTPKKINFTPAATGASAVSTAAGIAGAVGGAAGGPVGMIMSLASAFFGGLRAEGGPVSSGKGYIVGERGPEWFSPKISGTIIPNHSLGGGGGTSITVVNNITMEGRGGDQKQDDKFLQDLGAYIERSVRTAVTDEIRVQRRPGNMLYGGA